MFAKYSVKKPYTVLVAVILIIVLGIVAFINMTPNLLPNLDLQYIIVTTTYAGASPEEVETVVSKPIEQAMGTLNGLSEIRSTSRENFSLIIMEFTESTDMDVAAMNIRENLDRL